jgi:hypothetical protein
MASKLVATQTVVTRSATMAVVAATKSLRGEDPKEVARLCAILDETSGLMPGAWAAMLRGLTEDDEAVEEPEPEPEPPAEPVPVVQVSEPADVPSSVPFWQR